jgi:hypothetical protein
MPVRRTATSRLRDDFADWRLYSPARMVPAISTAPVRLSANAFRDAVARHVRYSLALARRLPLGAWTGLVAEAALD